MAFKAEKLVQEIDWDKVDENAHIMLSGKDRMVYWRGCNVTVYEKDSEGKEKTTPLVGQPDGQGLLPVGTELYITDGKWKEG